MTHTEVVQQLERLCEHLCRFACDYGASCDCVAHEMYRFAAKLLAERAEAPVHRDNGKPNRPHEFQEDPETAMCVICGWCEAAHDFAAPPAAPPEAP